MTAPATLEALLAQMVSFDTVNPRFGGAVGGEAALASHLDKLARGWGLETRRAAVAAVRPCRRPCSCCE